MPRPKKQANQDTRERVIKAADVLLHEYGYMGVSMDAVAEAVGIRKASLYHHFPEGKEELMLEIADRLVKHDAGGFSRAIETKKTAKERLEAIALFFFEENVQTDRILRDALRFMPKTHQKTVQAAFFKDMYLPIQQIFLDGVATKEFRKHDTTFSSWAFLGLISELNTLDEKSNLKLAKQIVDLIVNGLRP
jgi:AcrR family transcriptional regulator